MTLPEHDQNPYASPQAETAAAPILVPNRAPFGLERPIRAAGTIRRQDVRDGLRLVIPGGHTPLMLLVAALLLVWMIATDGPVEVFAHPLFPLLVTLVAIVVGAQLGVRSLLRRLAAEWCGAEIAPEFEFAEQTVRVKTASMESLRAWDAFSRCTISSRVALLHLHPASEWLTLPRSLFDPADWQAFLHLVRHKLPQRHLLSAPDPNDPALGVIGTEEMATWPAEPATPMIKGQGSVSLGQIRAVMWHLPGWWLWRLLPLALMVPIAAPAVFSIASGIHPDGLLVLSTFAGLMAIVWVFYVAERRSIAAQARLRTGPFALAAVRISPVAIRIESPYGVNVVNWRHYSAYRVARGALLLYFRSGTRAQVLPRTLFEDHQWQALLELVAARLPPV